jgi:periplasmic protein TonB
MRTGLIASLLLHGAAVAVLVLWGPAPAAPEPLGWIGVSMRADEAPEPEPIPEQDLPLPGPSRPAESWPLPEEAPAPPEIEAPEILRAEADRVLRVMRLPKPLARAARRTAPAAAAPPVVAIAPPAPANGVLEEPRLLPDSPRARYPARALRQGLEGTVVLLLSVAADGTVARAEVATSSGHEILDRAAEEAAALWRFEPARRDGVAIAYDIRQPVEFALEDA